MWILWKMRIWKCEFYQKMIFWNVIFFGWMEGFCPSVLLDSFPCITLLSLDVLSDVGAPIVSTTDSLHSFYVTAKDDSKSPVRGGGGRISVTAPPSRKTSAANNVSFLPFPLPLESILTQKFPIFYRATRTSQSFLVPPSAAQMRCSPHPSPRLVTFWAPPWVWAGACRPVPAPPWPLCIIATPVVLPVWTTMLIPLKGPSKWPKVGNQSTGGVDCGDPPPRWDHFDSIFHHCAMQNSCC